MTLDEAIKSLMALQAKLAAYGHAMGLLFYDGATGGGILSRERMPPCTPQANARGVPLDPRHWQFAV